MNKKIVSAFLAALLAVGAAGCGEVKDQGNDKSTPAETQATEATTTTTAATTTAAETTTAAAKDEDLTIDDAEKKVEENVEKAQKAAKGELDGAYKVVTTYTAPKEKNMKPVTLTVEVKQKDKLTGMNYEIGYDSKGLLTINAVYDNEKQTAYATVPQLSDGILTGTSEEIEKMVSDSVTPLAQTAASQAGAGETDGEAASPATVAAATAGVPDLEAFKNLDTEALTNDIASYITTFQENFPEAKDGKDYEVAEGGVTITLKTKTYTLTPEDTKKLVGAITDKGLKDDTLKDMFSAMGVSDDDYKGLWNSMKEGQENAETVSFDVYYNADETPVGFATKSDGVENHFVVASDDKNVIIDGDFGSQVSEKTMKGHFTYENDTLNGKLTVKNKTQDYDQKVVFEYKDLTVTDDKMVGDAIISSTANGEEAMKITYNFDINGDNGTMDIKMKMGGQDMGSVKVDMQKTDASDITVPSGTTYKFADQESIQKYTESCDVEGWKAECKKTLGDELYTQFFGAEEAAVDAGEAEAAATEKKADKKSA